MKKTTEKDILRFLELKEQASIIKSEMDALREQFIDDVDYMTPDAEHENVVTMKIGKSAVHVTTVIKPYFDTRKFGKEHPKLKAQYTTDKAEDRVTAETER